MLPKEVAHQHPGPQPGCVEPHPAQSGTARLQTLFERRRHFLQFLKRRVSSNVLAEDILQSAYLRALQSPAAPASADASTAWFYRILRNAVIDFYRHRSVEDRALESWAAELETAIAPNDLTRDTVCQCIARVLPTLKPSYAEAIQQVDLDEDSLTTYATRHAISSANATVRLHRARKALKQRLTETCGACAIQACLDCSCVG